MTYNPSNQLYILSAYLSARSGGIAPLITAYPSRAKSSLQSSYLVSVPSTRNAHSSNALSVTADIFVVVVIMFDVKCDDGDKALKCRMLNSNGHSKLQLVFNPQ
jgi:hypothetical protein